jgi:hypothetical protein
VTSEPEHQRTANASRLAEESVQTASERAIDRLAARQAAEVRAIGAELRAQLATTEATQSGAPPVYPPFEPQVLSLAGQQRSGAGRDVAVARPPARQRRQQALVVVLLLGLLLASLGGALSLRASVRHRHPGALGAAPPHTATAVLAAETPLVAAPVAAPLTPTARNATPSAALAAARVPTAAVATSMPAPTTVVAVISVTTPAATRAGGAPTAPPTSAPATPAPRAAAQRVGAAEDALRRGQLAAVLDYGNGVRATATLAFDYGDATQPQRLHLTTVYTSPTGSQTTERITIGDRAWDRQPDGRWVVLPEQEGVWGRVQPYLPHADRAPGPTLRTEVGGVSLHWIDDVQDVTVLFDPASGIPRELRQVSRANGATLVVTYRGWDTPVDIAPPTGT